MLRVVGGITQDHDRGLLVLALLVCVLATSTSVRLLTPSRDREHDQRTIRIGAAILAFSTGAWTTHFISILAFRPGVKFGFDGPLCLVSLLLAVAATGFAFASSRGNWRKAILARGLVLATGIATMHFTGMAALAAPGVVSYDPGLVVVSLVFGTVSAIAAMALLARRSLALASVFLILAVVSMHFIAMGSITLDLSTGIEIPLLGIPKPVLAIATGGASLLILALAAAASLLDRHLTDRLAREARRFRTLADATFEGLVFERSGRITDVNRAMCQLAASGAPTLIGLRLDDVIPGISLLAGAPDYPMEHVVLLPDGKTRPVEVLWRDDPDPGAHVVAIRDLSRQKAAESQIERLARFDSLTGLANREMFQHQLHKALALSDRGGSGVALLYVDLDRFETVHAALGPLGADQVLIEVALRLIGTVRESDTVARLGRDEFAIIQVLAEPSADTAALAERIVTEMALPFPVDDDPVTLGASVGVSLYPADGPEPQDLMRNAGQALRHAKQEGRGRWCYFEPGMDLLLRTKRTLEHDMRIALQEGQFSLHYQPFVAIESLEVSGYEALLRWDHPERGRVSPADFIPLAEETGLIVPIGSWVLATACAEAASWDDEAIISVNLSPAQFVQPGIVDTVADVLRRTGLPPARLELEITEGTLMHDTQNALRILTALKALGAKVAMDDFGTGYSSLSYLRKFPFDKIKIDRSFISDVEDDAEAETIVQAIIAMSRTLRLDVTAEGVETQRQLAMLRAHGCTFAQGHLLGRPCPASQLGIARRVGIGEHALPRLEVTVAAPSV
jgi:diguanylate cyclase (GGDEF)-like protein